MAVPFVRCSFVNLKAARQKVCIITAAPSECRGGKEGGIPPLMFNLHVSTYAVICVVVLFLRMCRRRNEEPKSLAALIVPLYMEGKINCLKWQILQPRLSNMRIHIHLHFLRTSIVGHQPGLNPRPPALKTLSAAWAKGRTYPSW